MIDNEIAQGGIVIASALVIFKLSKEIIMAAINKKEPIHVCKYGSGDSLLIQQTHEVALKMNETLLKHLSEIGSIASSVEELAKSIREKNDSTESTQNTQTKILQKLTEVIANKN